MIAGGTYKPAGLHGFYTRHSKAYKPVRSFNLLRFGVALQDTPSGSTGVCRAVASPTGTRVRLLSNATAHSLKMHAIHVKYNMGLSFCCACERVARECSFLKIVNLGLPSGSKPSLGIAKARNVRRIADRFNESCLCTLG
jgi:hypothetical protein